MWEGRQPRARTLHPCWSCKGHADLLLAGLKQGCTNAAPCSSLLPPPPHTHIDSTAPTGARWLGCAIGMTTGCLLGLLPLAFLEAQEGHSPQKERAHLSGADAAGAAAAPC